jgi:hypothetical protein
MRRLLAASCALAVVAACAKRPPPTPGAIALARNPRATVEGRVLDTEGRPVAGVQVQGIPGGRDVFWAPTDTTDRNGRFRLSLDAPSEYVFLIFDDRIGVVTPSPRDPSLVRIFLEAGETRGDIDLTLLREERELLVDPLKAARSRKGKPESVP